MSRIASFSRSMTSLILVRPSSSLPATKILRIDGFSLTAKVRRSAARSPSRPRPGRPRKSPSSRSRACPRAHLGSSVSQARTGGGRGSRRPRPCGCRGTGRLVTSNEAGACGAGRRPGRRRTRRRARARTGSAPAGRRCSASAERAGRPRRVSAVSERDDAAGNVGRHREPALTPPRRSTVHHAQPARHRSANSSLWVTTRIVMPLAIELEEQLVHSRAGLGVEVAGRLVGEEQARPRPARGPARHVAARRPTARRAGG